MTMEHFVLHLVAVVNRKTLFIAAVAHVHSIVEVERGGTACVEWFCFATHLLSMLRRRLESRRTSLRQLVDLSDAADDGTDYSHYNAGILKT